MRDQERLPLQDLKTGCDGEKKGSCAFVEHFKETKPQGVGLQSSFDNE